MTKTRSEPRGLRGTGLRDDILEGSILRNVPGR